MASSSPTKSKNPSSAASNEISEIDRLLRPNSNDVGWDYGIRTDVTNSDKVKCKLCGKHMSGGVSRIKQHIGQITGNVQSCRKASAEDIAKCVSAYQQPKLKKNEKRKQENDLRDEVHIIDERDEDVVLVGSSKSKKPHSLGAMDKFVRPINPDSSQSQATSKQMRQQNINDALFKKRSLEVSQFCARWVYESGIPFNAIDNDSFRRFVEAVGQFGPGWQPPTQYQLREPLLNHEVEKTKQSLKKHEEEWDINGCSIMTDAWSDRKRRSIMNLCVNCKEGTTFLSSIEASEHSHTGVYIFEYVDKCIEKIGECKIIQVVTDNASNNMAAANLLLIKRPNIFWTSCATHTVNLMLEGIGKQLRFKTVIEKAKALCIFIYTHGPVLGMFRVQTKKSDIVRPGVTRFATSFLTLQSLLEKKESLRLLFTSEWWGKSKLSKSVGGKTCVATVLSINFWNGIKLCLCVFSPLVKVLRLADGDKPSMGFIHGEMKVAKEEIKKVFKNNDVANAPILKVIEEKGKGRLDTPLHMAAFLLNPYYFYNDQEIQNEELVMEGVLTCIEKFFPNDLALQNRVFNVELLKYKKKEGMFGKSLAVAGCSINDDNYDPVGWWSNYGNATPNLRKMASRILALTSSSSGCERNWSTFEGIHTKKRNRLDTTRMNNLVYVQFNSKILNKKKRAKEKVDLLVASEASMAQGWIVEGGDDEDDGDISWKLIGEASGADQLLEPRKSGRNVRELDDTFDDVMEEEDKIDDDEDNAYDYESDGDRILEEFGYEYVGDDELV